MSKVYRMGHASKLPGVGNYVRISRGHCGEGYTFVVSSVLYPEDDSDDVQIYGDDDQYGPVRASEVEHVPSRYVPWSEEPRDCLGLSLYGRTRNEDSWS